MPSTPDGWGPWGTISYTMGSERNGGAAGTVMRHATAGSPLGCCRATGSKSFTVRSQRYGIGKLWPVPSPNSSRRSGNTAPDDMRMNFTIPPSEHSTGHGSNECHWQVYASWLPRERKWHHREGQRQTRWACRCGKASTPERSVLGQGEFQPTHDLGGKVVQEGKDH